MTNEHADEPRDRTSEGGDVTDEYRMDPDRIRLEVVLTVTGAIAALLRAVTP